MALISLCHPLKDDRSSVDTGSLHFLGVSGGGDPLPEDEPLEVIDEVRHPDFDLGAGDANRSDEEAHPIFLLRDDVLDTRANDRFEGVSATNELWPNLGDEG
jgi:hypothetical protein